MKKIMIAMMMALVLLPAMGQNRSSKTDRAFKTERTSKTVAKEHLKVFNIPITGLYDAFANKLKERNFEGNAKFQLLKFPPEQAPQGMREYGSFYGGDFWEFKGCQVKVGGVDNAETNVVTWVAIHPVDLDVFKLYDLVYKLKEKYGDYKLSQFRDEPKNNYVDRFTTYTWDLPSGKIEVKMDEYKVKVNDKREEKCLDGYVLYMDYMHKDLLE